MLLSFLFSKEKLAKEKRSQGFKIAKKSIKILKLQNSIPCLHLRQL